MFKKLFTAPIKFYQKYVSPSLGRNCRFYPSCSQYTIEAIEEWGVIIGIFLGAWRILRCNPFNKNCGYDPVPKNPKKGF